jgi:hypothetical protein
MNPRRVVEEFPDSLEAQLLRAGRAMTPTPSQVSRTLAAIGLTATAVGNAAARGALGFGVAATTKWAAIGVFSGVALVAVLFGSKVVLTQTAPQVPPQSTGVDPSLAGSQPLPGSTFSDTRRERSNSTMPSLAPEPSSAVEPARPTPVAMPTAAPGGTLGQEVAFIDRVRDELARQRPLRALGLLDGYHRQFPEPRLAEEVAYLRATALQSAGREQEAARAIREFRKRYPSSPLMPPD